MKVWVVSRVQEFKAMGLNHEVSKPVTVEYCGEWAEVYIKAQSKEPNVSYRTDVVEMGAPMEAPVHKNAFPVVRC